MSERRILRRDGELMTVATESKFNSEEDLHRAVAAHPEVLPGEDVGLGLLVPLANELDLGHGPIDLLCSDGRGRLVIVEFKRGSENPDVRKVVAQVLDYGATRRRWLEPARGAGSTLARRAPSSAVLCRRRCRFEDADRPEPIRLAANLVAPRRHP